MTIYRLKLSKVNKGPIDLNDSILVEASSLCFNDTWKNGPTPLKSEFDEFFKYRKYLNDFISTFYFDMIFLYLQLFHFSLHLQIAWLYQYFDD